VTAGRRRLFVALELPPAARAGLAGWASAALGRIDGLRLLDAADLHVTIAFLGWRAGPDAAAAAHIVAGLGGPAPELTPARVAWLPPRRPHLAAVDLDDPDGTAGVLQARAAAALSAELGMPTDSRPFRPHVTVARLPRAARPHRGPGVPDPPARPFRAPAVSLFESHLEQAGARYEVLARQPLTGA
jgi:RNA 2',3'-cyclic 3'-phosphodiesterase